MPREAERPCCNGMSTCPFQQYPTRGEWRQPRHHQSILTMSKLPLATIFSAAHVSKWDTLSEDTLTRATESRIELERPTRPSVNDQSNDADCDACVPSESSKSDEGVFSTRECEVTMQVAASVSGAVAMNPPARRHVGPHGTKSRGTYIFIPPV